VIHLSFGEGHARLSLPNIVRELTKEKGGERRRLWGNLSTGKRKKAGFPLAYTNNVQREGGGKRKRKKKRKNRAG